MTPNKLPPLPEPAVKSFKPATHDTAGHVIYTFSADQMHAYAAEAIRQSQSLPAGAVAGLVARWRSDADDCEINALEADSIGLDKEANRSDSRMIGYRTCADELEQALQADAREKGEAGVAEALRIFIGAQYPVAESIDPRGYRWSEAYLDEALTIARQALATQPAQASEVVGYVDGPVGAMSGTIKLTSGLLPSGTNLYDAPVAAKPPDDTKRLDFVLANDAFLWRDEGKPGETTYQLWTQDTDENYICNHSVTEFFSTPRDAIDAALASSQHGESNNG